MEVLAAQSCLNLQPACQKRSFLSQPLLTSESLENLVPQTLGKTVFDVVTFLAAHKKRSLVQAAASGKLGSNQTSEAAQDPEWEVVFRPPLRPFAALLPACSLRSAASPDLPFAAAAHSQERQMPAERTKRRSGKFKIFWQTSGRLGFPENPSCICECDQRQRLKCLCFGFPGSSLVKSRSTP